MKRIVLSILLLTSLPAIADDKTPSKPVCGKSVIECQKVVDDLTGKLNQMTLAYQGARQQRINIETAKADAEIDIYISQQTAAKIIPKP